MEKLGPHDLIQSFIAGLSDFLATLIGPTQEETRAIAFLFTSTTSQTWTVDRECFVVGWQAQFGMVLTTNAGYGSYNNAYGATAIRTDIIAATGGNTVGLGGNIGTIRFRLSVGQKLVVYANGVGHMMVYLTP